MSRKLLAFCAALVVILLAASPAWAQEVRGTILGRVTDPTGAVIPSVKIKVINAGTSVAVNVVSNEQGNYQVPYLLVGDYRVEVEAQGFKKYSRTGIRVQTSDRIELDITLRGRRRRRDGDGDRRGAAAGDSIGVDGIDHRHAARG